MPSQTRRKKSPRGGAPSSGATTRSPHPKSRTKNVVNIDDDDDDDDDTFHRPPQRPCRYFAMGNCRFGDRCLNSHDIIANATRDDSNKNTSFDARHQQQEVCRFFASNGFCRYGDKCFYSHDATRATEESNKVAEADAVCGICLEQVGLNKKFGLLSCCDHVFCLSCVMKWRQTAKNEDSHDIVAPSSNDHHVHQCCPTCRKRSDYVIPSKVFATGDAKEVIVANYKAKLATMPCKHFDGETLGSCPFGRDCFYAHIDDYSGEDMKALDQSMEELYQERQERRMENQEDGPMDMLLIQLMMLHDIVGRLTDDDDIAEEDFFSFEEVFGEFEQFFVREQH